MCVWVVVGGGWAGFGACRHLAREGFGVTLLDAQPNPGGLSAGSGAASADRTMEAGMKGFWYQYHNIFRLADELGLEEPFTDWTESSFFSPSGLVTEGPVFQSKPRLPALLGQAVHTFPLFRNMPLEDRLSMLPLFYAIIDHANDRETFAEYDERTARELFREFGVSERLYREFLRPLLLVGLFAPPEELSAAAVLSCLYFYAIAHQPDFDMKWCRGTVTETFFTPLVERIREDGGEVLGGQRMTELVVDPAGVVRGVKAVGEGGEETEFECDAVVFAVGITGMQNIIRGSSLLSGREEFCRIMRLSGIDCVAVRLWLDRHVAVKHPANVLGNFSGDAGSTFFILNDLHDEYKDADGTVVASDFYNSSELMPLSDEEIVARVKQNLQACVPGFAAAQVVDSRVIRASRAVTKFSPGSYKNMPTQETSIPNVVMSGDWVKDVPHGANGLSQERAYVTGLRAANMVIQKLGVGRPCEILDVEEDEEHIKLAKELNRNLRSLPFQPRWLKPAPLGSR